MKLIIVTLCILLTACATPPQWLANYYNNNDTCQRTELIATGQYPSWCGGASGKVYVTREAYTNRVLTYTK